MNQPTDGSSHYLDDIEKLKREVMYLAHDLVDPTKDIGNSVKALCDMVDALDDLKKKIIEAVLNRKGEP